MANPAQLIPVDTIQGTSFVAIRAVVGSIQRLKADVADYDIQVVRENNAVTVLFTEKGGQGSDPKKIGVRQGSKIEMNAQELNQLMSNTANLTVLDTIQGTSLLAIDAAFAIFQRHNPDLTHYRIQVVREGDSTIVIFADKDQQPGARGGGGKRPTFEVELNAKDLRVLRSNFVR